MTDFLLELRSEEIPARMQAKAREDLARLFAAELARAGIVARDLVTYATPRRLALIARDLPQATQAVSEEVKGPKTSAPPQALEGFLRKTGLTRDQLTERDGILFAVTRKPGRATADVLADAIPAIVRAFPWPKSMRWGAASTSTESPRWVRPLQGIVALFGEEIVPFEIAGVVSGAATLGHRFHHPGVITIGSANDYAEKLRACHVIVDPNERAALIRERAHALATEAGLMLVEDEGLVAENAGLTEWPVPLLGRFDETFLDVPPEVIQLTARVNQKYFVCRSGDGALANAFICTANIDSTDGGAKIVDGNRKVLAARLSDAKFFYDTDLKVPLEQQAEKLGKIVFHEKLGTLADKVDRVAKLARWLVEEGIIAPLPAREGLGVGMRREASHSTPTAETSLRSAPTPYPSLAGRGEEVAKLANLAHRAARLCKADLVTGMVGEFPELQGLMGGYYALAQGEDPQVAEAIRDHYKPVGQGDEVPTAPVTVAVSLADKLDTIMAFFAVGEFPSGSKDPYALRRSALGVIALLAKENIRLSLNSCSRYLSSLLRESFERRRAHIDNVVIPAALSHTTLTGERLVAIEAIRWKPLKLILQSGLEGRDVLLAQSHIIADYYAVDTLADYENAGIIWLTDFFADRLKVQQREAGVRHDLIDAVFALGGEDDLVRLLARVHALQAFVGTEDGANLLAGYKRAANILKKEGYEGPTDIRHPGLVPGSTAPRGAASETLWTPEQARSGENSLSYTPEPCEAALIAVLDSAEPAAARAVEAEDFESAMAALATLRVPIDAFFDSVIVNDPDAAKRSSRLALLARVRAAVHNVADFSQIEG